MGFKDWLARHRVIVISAAAVLVVGIAAGIVIYRLAPSPYAKYLTTTAPPSTTEGPTEPRPTPGTLADAERFAEQVIAYGKTRKLSFVAPEDADTADEASWLAFNRTVYKSEDYTADAESYFEYAEQCWVRYSFTPSGSFTVECKAAKDKLDGDVYEVHLSFQGAYYKNP